MGVPGESRPAIGSVVIAGPIRYLSFSYHVQNAGKSGIMPAVRIPVRNGGPVAPRRTTGFQLRGAACLYGKALSL